MLALGACAPPGAPAVCAAPLRPAVEIDLYFGRDRPGAGEVNEATWAAFLIEVVTPRFPDGLSVLDIEGQSRAPSDGRVVRERSKLLVVVVFDPPAHRVKVAEIVAAYVQRFGQHGVFRTERTVCAGLQQ